MQSTILLNSVHSELECLELLKQIGEHIERNNWQHLYTSIPYLAKQDAQYRSEQQKVLLLFRLLEEIEFVLSEVKDSLSDLQAVENYINHNYESQRP